MKNNMENKLTADSTLWEMMEKIRKAEKNIFCIDEIVVLVKQDMTTDDKYVYTWRIDNFDRKLQYRRNYNMGMTQRLVNTGLICRYE